MGHPRRKGPGVPAAAAGVFWVPASAKARTKGKKSILQLYLPYLVGLPLVLPEKQPHFLPLWRRLCLVPSSKSRQMSREHPEHPVRLQARLPGRAPVPPPAEQEPLFLLVL